MHVWTEKTSTEIKTFIQENPNGWALLPFGSVEQHGPHLCVAYDHLISERLCQDIATKRSDCIILPTLSLGQSGHHLGLPGTITLKTATVMAILNDVADSLVDNGIKNLLVTNGHGGNYVHIDNFAKSYSDLNIKHDGDRKFLFEIIYDLRDNHGYDMKELGVHAGLFECSLAMYTHKNSVRPELFAEGAHPFDPDFDKSNIYKDGVKAYFPKGTMGDPTNSNLELGESIYKSLLEKYLSLVNPS